MVATMLFALASRHCQTPCSQPHPTYVLPSISWPEAVELMAKFDVASAYRNAAIRPLDRQLLGMN